MFEEDKEELPPGQTDEIGRRMAEVIEEVEVEKATTEHVVPHWELFYDEEHDNAEQIVHLHGEEKVPARVTAHADGSSFAECSQCNATLDISTATRPRRDASQAASAKTTSA